MRIYDIEKKRGIHSCQVVCVDYGVESIKERREVVLMYFMLLKNRLQKDLYLFESRLGETNIRQEVRFCYNYVFRLQRYEVN